MTTDRDNTSPPPALDGVEHWPYWKEKVKGIDFGKSGFYDIALFIFCTLNEKNNADIVRTFLMGIID